MRIPEASSVWRVIDDGGNYHGPFLFDEMVSVDDLMHFFRLHMPEFYAAFTPRTRFFAILEDMWNARWYDWAGILHEEDYRETGTGGVGTGVAGCVICNNRADIHDRA